MVDRVGAHELIGLVADPDSFEPWDTPPDLSDLDESYRSSLDRAAAKAGTDESVVTGAVTVDGYRVAVVVGEFRFLAGSIGRAAAERVVAAVRRATAEGLPVLASTASGGTRMQEGTPAFVRMIDIAQAVAEHRRAGLAYLVHLRHPTTGGVMASWGSLGHLTAAEPEALTGFLGPKVYELLEGEPFPADVQTGEHLADVGVVDAVVPTKRLRDVVARVLGLLLGTDQPSSLTRRAPAESARRGAWESVEITRGAGRPDLRDLLEHGASDVVRLSGTSEGERSAAVVVALARLDGVACVVVGQDGAAQAGGASLGPAALRSVRRGVRLAAELGLPLVSVVDTPGAELSAAAEEGAMAGEIARCLAELSTLAVPSVSVLLGQGCGGGALAMLPAARVVAAESSWLTPLPPEGASAIVHGDVEHAPEMAERQRVTVFDLRDAGVVHAIVPEPDGDTTAAFSAAVAAEVGAQLRELLV